jgi:NDP-sugar pyrophosphorylase family protein
MVPPEATVIVLAGGAGTRIRHLYPDVPKPLIPVAGATFLDWVCRYWKNQGLRRILVSIGHLAEVAERHLREHPLQGVEVYAVREEQALGTAGGIRLAAGSPHAGDPLIACNGDSLVFSDVSGVWPILAREELQGVLLGVEVPDASRYGSLHVAEDGLLRGFAEKRPGRGLVNAGVFFFKRRLLARFPARTPLSLETDVFPLLLAGGVRIQVVPVKEDFLDIGTPEGLAQADGFVGRHLEELT